MNIEKIKDVHEFVKNCILMINKTHSELFDLGYQIILIQYQFSGVTAPSYGFTLYNDHNGVSIIYNFQIFPVKVNGLRMSMLFKRKNKKYDYINFPKLVKHKGYDLPSEMIANSVDEDHLLCLELSVAKLLEILLKDFKGLVLGEAWHGNLI